MTALLGLDALQARLAAHQPGQAQLCSRPDASRCVAQLPSHSLDKAATSLCCRAATLEHVAERPAPEREQHVATEDLQLPQYDSASGQVELMVAGAGPSGLAVAERVSQAGSSWLSVYEAADWQHAVLEV